MPSETKDYMEERRLKTGYYGSDDAKKDDATGDTSKGTVGGDKKPEEKKDDGIQEQIKAIDSRLANRDSQMKRIESQMQEIMEALKPKKADDDDVDDTKEDKPAGKSKVPEGFEGVQAALKQQEAALMKKLQPLVSQVHDLTIREQIVALREDEKLNEQVKSLPDDVRKSLTARVAKFVATYEPEAGENAVEEALRYLIHRHGQSTTKDKTDFLPEGGGRTDADRKDATLKANEQIFGMRFDPEDKAEIAPYIDGR